MRRKYAFNILSSLCKVELEGDVLMITSGINASKNECLNDLIALLT